MLKKMSAVESRAAWLISSYRNVTIGGNTPNNAEAQKFGWVDVLTRLRINPADPVPVNRFVSLMTASTQFNAAFMSAGAAWIMYEHWDRFSPAQRALCLQRFKSAGAAVNSHGTENHFLIRNVGAFIWGELWPNETGWPNGLTGAQMRQQAKSRLLVFLRNLFSKGYSEHLSINYVPVHLYPLQALYSCAQDPEVKAAADAALTLYAVDMAVNFFKGSTIYPWSRDAAQRASDPQNNRSLNTHIKAVYWLWWAELMNTPSTTTATFVSAGARGWGTEARHFAVTCALSSWRPPAQCVELAQQPISLSGSVKQFGEHGAGDPAHVIRTVWKTQTFAVGSANYANLIDPPPTGRSPGVSDRNGHGILLASTKAQNEIIVHHPYWKSNADQHRWLCRSSPFVQHAQHEGIIISLFNIPATDPLANRGDVTWQGFRNEGMIQQSWIRYPRVLDEQADQDGWLFLREGQTFVAIRSSVAWTIDNTEFTDMTVLRASGAKNVVISEVANTQQYKSFAAFRNAVLAKTLTFNLNTLQVQYGNLLAAWGPFNAAAPFFLSFPTLLVNGMPKQMRDPDFVAERALMKSSVLSVEGRVMRTSGLVVDWSGARPVFSTGTAGPAPQPAPQPQPEPAPAPEPEPTQPPMQEPALLTLAQRIAAQLPCSDEQAKQAITLCADRLQQLRRVPAAEALRREMR
jgi:hypothetical protein